MPGRPSARRPEKSKPNRDNAGMKILRPISILVSYLMLTASAVAQISLTPPPAADQPAAKDTEKQKPKPPVVAKKPAAPAATPKPAATPAPAATVTPAPAVDE